MNQDSEPCTWLNAEAVWKIWPSGIVPAKKRGATTMYGKDDGELRVERLEPVELLSLAHELPPVADHRGEALPQPAELFVLAAVERHAFAVLAQAHEREAEVGFHALLVEVQPDELAADVVRQQRADASRR